MVRLRERVGLCSVLCFLLSLVLFGSAREARAQSVSFPGLWTQEQNLTTSPSARYDASMAYDAKTGDVVLFGGLNGSSFLNDTWIWDGTSWSQEKNLTTSPSARDGASMAYDAQTGDVVLFGGSDNSGVLDDTWIWDGTSWTQEKNLTMSPPARDGASMAYDAQTGNVVLFGGQNSSGFPGGTWIWDGTSWTQEKNLTTSPSGRWGASMAYDAKTGNVLLFGGYNGSTVLADTWTWNGTSWTQQSPANSPPAREFASMAYDAQAGNAVLFGGDNGGSWLGDTWIWDGTIWTQEQNLNPSPSARNGASMAYDAKTSKVLLFGGFRFSTIRIYPDHTWTYQLGSVNMGSANVCPGTQTTPSPCSQTATLTFNVTANTTMNATTPVSVLTQGAPNLDFTSTANTCTGKLTAPTTCAVTVKFAPKFAGERKGAVVLYDSTDTPIATVYVYGTGVGPQAAFAQQDASGNFLPAATSTLGSGFSAPFGVAVDGAGDVFVADEGNSNVKEIEAVNGSIPANPTVRTLGGGFSLPLGVAVDGAGDVFVADAINSAVKEIPASCISGANNSTCVRTLGGGFRSPEGVAVDAAGNVFVADLGSSKVKEIEAVNGSIPANPTIRTLGGGFSDPEGVAVDAAGDVFVADTINSAVKEIPASCISGANNSTCVRTLGSGFGDPAGVAVDAAGNVFVADEGNSKVKEIEAVNGSIPANPAIGTLGSGFHDPSGVAADAAGNLFVADFSNNAVKEMDFADPPSLSFAGAVVGTQSSDSPQSINVQNIGNADLTFPVPASGNNPVLSPSSFTFDGTPTCPQVSASIGKAGTLAAGADCTYGVNFIPATAGTISGSLALTDDALNAAAPNYATQAVTLTGVGLTTTTTTLSANSSSINPNQSVTFTATVTSAASGTPTGTVSFYDGSTLLGTGTLDNTGKATFSTSSLSPATTHTITATYSGDGTFAPSSTTAAVSVVVAPLDFTFTTVPSSPTPVAAGGTATFQFTLTPTYGSYPAAVNFATTNLPPGATATFSPATVAANGGKQTITMTVKTSAQSAMAQPASSIGRRLAPLSLAFLLLPFFGLGRTRRRLSRLLCVLLLAGGLAAAVSLTGCGGSSSKVGHYYPISVTATSGTTQHQASALLVTK